MPPPSILELQRRAFQLGLPSVPQLQQGAFQGVFRQPILGQQQVAFQGPSIQGPTSPVMFPPPQTTGAVQALRERLFAQQAGRMRPQTLPELTLGRELTPIDLAFAGAFPLATPLFLGAEAIGRQGARALPGTPIPPELAAGALPFAPFGAAGGIRAAQAVPGALKFGLGAGGPIGGAATRAAAKGLLQPTQLPPGVEDPTRKLARIIDFVRKPPIAGGPSPRAAFTEAKGEELARRVARSAGVLEARARGGVVTPAILEESRAAIGTGELASRAINLPPDLVPTPFDMQTFAQIIGKSPTRQLDKVKAWDAVKALGMGQPEIITVSEQQLLGKLFGIEVERAIARNRTFGQKAWAEAMDALGLPRVILASFDMSFPLRQGVVLAPGRPKEWLESGGVMIKAFGRESVAQQADDIMRADADFLILEAGGLFAPRVTGEATLLEASEIFPLTRNTFAARLARSIAPIRMSERAFLTMGNQQRWRVGKTVLNEWRKAGQQFTDDDVRLLARFLNHATGRGDLPSFAREFAPVFNIGFFSPRLILSRFELPLDVGEAALRGSPVLKEMARDLGAFVGTGLAVLSLLRLSGASVQTDPRSSDFGKIQIGKQRFDFWGGFQSPARYTAQLITGQRRDSVDEVVPADRGNTILRFLRSKASPPAAALTDVTLGETFIGQELGPEPEVVRRELIQRLVPFFWQDLIDSVREEGATGGFLAAPGFFGVTVQAYETQLQKRRRIAQEEAESRPGLFVNSEQVAQDGTKAMTQQEFEEFQFRHQDLFQPRDETVARRENLAELRDLVQKREVPLSRYGDSRGEVIRDSLIESDFEPAPSAPLRQRVVHRFFNRLDEREEEMPAELLSGRDRIDAEKEVRAEIEAEFGVEGLDGLDEVLTASADPLEKEYLLDRALLDEDFNVGVVRYSWSNAGDIAWPIVRSEFRVPESFETFEDYLSFVQIAGQETGNVPADSRVVRRFYEVRANGRNALALAHPEVGAAVMLWGFSRLRDDTESAIAESWRRRHDEVFGRIGGPIRP